MKSTFFHMTKNLYRSSILCMTIFCPNMALLLNPVSSTLISRGEPSDLNPITPQIKVSKPVTYNGAILTTNCLIPQIGAANQAQSTFNDYSGISNNYDLYAPRKWEQDGTLDAVFQTLQINKENFQSWGGDVIRTDAVARRRPKTNRRNIVCSTRRLREGPLQLLDQCPRRHGNRR